MKSKLILTALVSFLLTEIGAKTTEDTSLKAQTLDVGTANAEETYAPALKPEMTSRQDETWNELTERSLQSCSSTNNGANDAYGDTCTWYANYPDSCGRYDDADFRAASMCCECGGGSGSSPYQTKKLASTRTEAVETVEVTIVLGTMKAIQTNAEITTIQISTQILIAALAVAESMELTQLLQTEVIVAGAKTPTTELEMLGTTPANGTPQTSAHVEITMMMISLQVPCVATVMAEALEVAGTPETLKAP